MKKLWIEKEAQYYNEIFIQRINNSKICLVSVHGVMHYNSDNSLKKTDLNTKGLTLALAEMLNCSFFCYVQTDPSISPYQSNPPVINFLKQLPKDTLVIDLHGAKNSMIFDYALGTHLTNPTSKQLDFFNFFKNNHHKSYLNLPNYSAKSKKTVTGMAIDLGLEAVQVEMIYDLRDWSNPRSDENIEKLYRILKEYEKIR